MPLEGRGGNKRPGRHGWGGGRKIVVQEGRWGTQEAEEGERARRHRHEMRMAGSHIYMEGMGAHAWLKHMVW